MSVMTPICAVYLVRYFRPEMDLTFLLPWRNTRSDLALDAVRPLIVLQTLHGCPGNEVGYVLRQSESGEVKNEDASSCRHARCVIERAIRLVHAGMLCAGGSPVIGLSVLE